MKRSMWHLTALLLLTPILAFARDGFKTIDIPSTDGLTVKADFYQGTNDKLPIILLFHQAGYSRGEYREIAPKLVALGYTCIAIDQRSGKAVNGVENQTAKQALSKGLGTSYADAYADLEATLTFAKQRYKNKKFIAWGSSYSSSLVFILAAKYPADIVGTLSFSPGEYFKFEGKKIADYAKQVKSPAFVTSAKNEENSWKAIYQSVTVKNKNYFLPTAKGFHGSKALWASKEGHTAYWKAVKAFLASVSK